ncbi:MAG: 2-dehydropantoate 2-reductase [Bermanella sp.]
MLPIHILGTGAMACLWASYFTEQHSLNFIGRSLGKEMFRFTLKPQNKTIEGHYFSAQNLNTPIEHLIVATKAFDAQSAVESIQHCLSPNAQILLLQNGMGSQQSIAQKFDHYGVYACSSTEGAYKTNAHTLVHAGKGINNIGPMNDKADKSRLRQWLPESGYQWHDHIETILWKKLFINGAINPLTLLYRCKNGELIKQDYMRQHMIEICSELDLLLDRLPLKLAPAFSMAEEICMSTANNFSSMNQDGKNNRPTEIDFITGYLVNKCTELAIPCPKNLQLLEKVKQLNLGH